MTKQRLVLTRSDKKYCEGCKKDFYNHGNNSATGECWMLKKAKAVVRYRIGWWTMPDKAANFTQVTINNCHIELGCYAYYEKLPEHLSNKEEEVK